MTGNEKVILDAGHGGDEPGAIYNGRKEKDDTLRLTLAVGRILEENGVSTLYTRTTDVYDRPQEKAEIANRSKNNNQRSLRTEITRTSVLADVSPSK